MRMRAILAVAFLAGLAGPGAAAPEDAGNFLDEIATLQGKHFSIRTNNGPVRQGMSAEINVLDTYSYDIVTTLTRQDGSTMPFAHDAYRFHLGELGLVDGHFRTEYTRSNDRASAPYDCDSFMFLSTSMQMDCYQPQNFRADRQATRLEFTAVWQLKPETFEIRIISNSGAAFLSAAR